jgi:hypothetical protein
MLTGISRKRVLDMGGETNSERCPRCGKVHMMGPYGPRPELRVPDSKGMPYAPPDVQCDCGAVLRVQTPIFKVTASGWNWKIL